MMAFRKAGRRVGEVAAGGDPEVLAEDFPKCVVRIVPGKDMIRAPEEEGQTLTQMTKDDFQIGMGLEYT